MVREVHVLEKVRGPLSARSSGGSKTLVMRELGGYLDGVTRAALDTHGLPGDPFRVGVSHTLGRLEAARVRIRPVTGGARTLAKRAIARLAPDAIVFHGPRTGARRIAFTFDDGPEALTRRYLDMLDESGVRATFFVVGRLAEKRPDDLRQTVERGHEVAGHGFSHAPFPDLAGPVIASELLLTQDMLPPSLLPRPMVRPPYGHMSVRSIASTALAGFTSVLWSVDSDDCRTEDPNVVASRIAPESLRTGDIVLLHEGQKWTLDAMPAALARLKDAGFEFVTVSQLLDPRLG